MRRLNQKKKSYDLYATLNNKFLIPSQHSSQNFKCHHYHILIGDFNSWVGTEQGEHLSNHSEFPHIPLRIGDPDSKQQPQGRVPNSTSATTHARARGRMLLDFLNHHTFLIENYCFLSSSIDPTYENQIEHHPFSPHLQTTNHDTTVDYFIVSKLITPHVTQCATHFNCWHSLPPIHPSIDETPGKRYPVRTNHNILISFLLPSHPSLGNNHLPDHQHPTQQSYHSWKLKYGNIRKSFKEDFDLIASTILSTLKDIHKNTKNLPPQP